MNKPNKKPTIIRNKPIPDFPWRSKYSYPRYMTIKKIKFQRENGAETVKKLPIKHAMKPKKLFIDLEPFISFGILISDFGTLRFIINKNFLK